MYIVRVLLLCIALAGSGVATPVLAASVGLNKFDLFKQYLGLASGGDGSPPYRNVTKAMAKKAILDARDMGVTYLRISATGYAAKAAGKPGDLDLWMSDRAAYWRLFDEMMSDLQQAGVKAVLTVLWNKYQFPLLAGDRIGDLLTNPNSRSYRLFAEYTQELVSRYRNHPSVYFWELSNELNLGADLDHMRRCQGNRKETAPCEVSSNFSTRDISEFGARAVRLIKTIDPVHPVSSGYSIPRAMAYRLSRNPEWQTGKLGRNDSREDFERYLIESHRPFDIISIHLYNKPQNRRFGSSDPLDLLEVANSAAVRAGKPLFIGEFGDPALPDARASGFAQRLLAKIVELRIAYSAAWILEFYQKNTYQLEDNLGQRFGIEPGVTDHFIRDLQSTNQALGNRGPSRDTADTVAPRIVITWPIECYHPDGFVPKSVVATVSDDRGVVERVEFWAGNALLLLDKNPPYELILSNLPGSAGLDRVDVRAFDASGNMGAKSLALRSAKASSCSIQPR